MNPAPTLDSGRNPFEQFLLCLGLVSGVPLLFGAPPPATVAQLLSPWLVHVWALFLVLGCLTALMGVWWTWWACLSRWWPWLTPEVGTGLLVERLGLISVGVGALVYGIGIITAGISGATVPGGIVLAWGLACFWRAWQIRRWVQAAIRAKGAL